MSTLILRAGEPRPWFASYIAKTYPGVVSYDPVPIVFQCFLDKEKNKFVREFLFNGKLKKPKTPFVMFGATVVSKHGCKGANKAREKGIADATPDAARHWFWVLWNVATKHVYVNNHPFVYHQSSADDFTPDPLTNRFIKSLPEWMSEQGYTDIIVTRNDKFSAHAVQKVKKWVNARLNSTPPTIWYPLLVLWMLKVHLTHPQSTSKERTELMKHTLQEDINVWLTHTQASFEQFYLKQARARARELCKRAPRVLYNPETANCVDPSGETGLSIQGIKKEKQSHSISGKFLEQSLMSPTSSDKTFIDHIYSQPVLIRYIASKYPHAALSNERIIWRKDVDNGNYLYFTPNFVSFWQEALDNPNVKQILTYVNLNAKKILESHANVLIYTKATQELEIFEPNGADSLDTFSSEEMFSQLGAAMKKQFGHNQLLTPKDYCPAKMSVFQYVEGNEETLWDNEGYCAVWVVWYSEIRMLNPTETTKRCIEIAMNKLLDLGSLRAFIWNYDRWTRRDFVKKEFTLPVESKSKSDSKSKSVEEVPVETKTKKIPSRETKTKATKTKKMPSHSQ